MDRVIVKPNFEWYLELLDRILERKGLSKEKRDTLFNNEDNANIIADSFDKRIHPSILVKKLDLSSVIDLQFVSESESESTEEIGLTPGQTYAVKFLKTIGLEHISKPIQLKHGNLYFLDPIDLTEYAIFKTGYLRKFPKDSDRWQVMHRLFEPQYVEKTSISDDEYMDLAEILVEKIRKSRIKQEKTKVINQSKVDALFKRLDDCILHKNNMAHHASYSYDKQNNTIGITDVEIQEAIKKLYNKYVNI